MNVLSIVVTRLVSQLPIAASNAVAALKVDCIVVTLLVSQLSMKLPGLKLMAPSNVCVISVTRDISHAPIAALNPLALSLKIQGQRQRVLLFA